MLVLMFRGNGASVRFQIWLAASDFDRPASGVAGTGGQRWSCRSYYITDGTLLYVLGFGTTNRESMFPLYDKMARTFVAKDS